MENISNTYSSFPVPKDAWDLLSLPEKSEMMKVAIKNGITNLQDIRDSYNEFSRGGYVPSKAIKDRISFYEGKAMTGAKDPITGKWGKNNSFENEAAKFYSVLPESIREQVLSNQDLADNLYSYSYNVGAGNFRKRVVPALERYYSGEGSIRDVENSMWASNDSKLRGLQRRRAEEKEGVRNALLGNMGAVPSTNQEPFEFIPSNPQAFFNPYLYQQADIIPEPPVYKEEEVNPYSKKELEKQDRKQRLNTLSMVLGMSNPYPTENNSMLNAIGLLTGNSYAKGGSIHIKPENREKFTRLKKRTGHSASWFKAHGTPAQKKMATFALNAKKWKHGLGGNLYEFGGDGGNNPRIVTTGGAGYVPSTNINPEEVKNKIRKNLYDNVNTHSYQSLSDAILGGLGVKSTATNRIIESQDELTDANGNYIDFNAYESPMDDAIWATYLGIPKNQRRKRSGELKISKYTPSIGKENGTIYYEFPITDPKYVIHKSDNLPINGNKVVDMDYYGAINVGDFTVGRGYDSRGEYRSVYDKWDINPFGGVYRKKGLIGNIGNRLLGKKEDLSFGIGKPVNLYNRIYLDDYYKVPAPYRGGVYLPEVTVYGKKKKKAYGGNLFDGTSQPTQQMNNGKVLVTNSYGDNYYIDPRQVNSTEWNLTTPEVSVTANPDDVARGRAERWFRDFGTESNDATSVAGGRRQNSHLDEWGIEGAAKAAAWAKDHPVLNNVGLGLSTIPLAVAATPAVVGGGEFAATALANPYVDAALTSMGGAHAAQSLANGEANWMTAMELAPLGRLAKPLYEGVVQPGMRLFNSPLTGNWTKIGNREYRLSPNSLGANGNSIESRSITPQITAENAASMTPEQWTAAQDAAIARGDMAEAQRLRDLHFQVSAPTPYISKGVYLPSGSQPTISQADYYNGNNDLVTLYHSSVDADNLIKEGFDGVERGLGRTKGEAKGTIFASANPDYAADYSNLYVQEGYSTPDKVGLIELKVPRGAGTYEGSEVRLRPEHIKQITKSAYEKTPWLKWLKIRKTDNSLFNIKSADAVTYDDNGVRIPLGERDNFNINDIRYYESPNREAMKGIKYIEQTPSATSLDAEQQLVQRLKSYTPKIGENGLVGYKPLNSGDVVNIPEEAIERQIQKFVDSGMERESAIEYLREQFGYGAMTQNGKTFLLPEKYMITNPEYMKAHDAIHRVLRFDDSFSIPGAEGLNPNEAVAMISGEIKPALGIRANEPLTEEMLDKWLKTTNEKITGRYGFSSKIKDKKKFLKWANITAPAILPFGIGLTGYGLLQGSE